MINGMRNESSARSGEIVWIMWWSWENGISSASLADTWITTTAREVIYRWRKMLRLGEQCTRESRGAVAELKRVGGLHHEYVRLAA
jgi:hypothetical protein